MACGHTNKEPGFVLDSSDGGGLQTSLTTIPAQRPSHKFWKIRAPELAAWVKALGKCLL